MLYRRVCRQDTHLKNDPPKQPSKVETTIVYHSGQPQMILFQLELRCACLGFCLLWVLVWFETGSGTGYEEQSDLQLTDNCL